MEATNRFEIDFPFRVDGRGRTARSDGDEHVRDLIEQVLFTAPGERVNRPTFGTGLMQLVFAGNGARTMDFEVRRQSGCYFISSPMMS